MSEFEINKEKPVEPQESYSEIMDRLRENPLTLVRKDLQMTVENIRKISDGQPTLVCDVPINELLTSGQPIVGGYNLDEIINIDHHFEGDSRFTKHISSTNLAMEYVALNGPVESNVKTIINHVDCDSVLSAGIMRGILPPSVELGEAAIIADHIGAPNQIADLLQALEEERDVELSYRNLGLLLTGKPIEPKARELLLKRFSDREKLLRAVEEEVEFTQDGKIAYLETEENIDSGLLPALIPTAQIVVLFAPRFIKDDAGEYLPGRQSKVRLGLAAPEGMDIRKIIKKFDKNFGGRWNAGSNERNGNGLEMEPEDYIQALSNSLSEY